MPTGVTFKTQEKKASNSLYLILSVVMGVAGAFAALGFKTLIGFFNARISSFSGDIRTTQELGFIGLQGAGMLAVMLFLVACLISAVVFAGKLKRFHGVADTIEGARRPDAQVDVKDGLLSSLVASLSIAGGAPVGQYGPLVHLGATLASVVSKLGNLPRNASETLLACGVAGAISAAFGAPIAAVLFVHEAVLRHFSLRTFAPVTVASVMAYVVMQNLFPTPPFLPAINLAVATPSSVMLLCLVGLGGGVLASSFMRVCLSSELAVPRMGLPLWSLPFAGAVVLLCAGMFAPQILGTNMDIMHLAIAGEVDLLVLAVLCLGKLVLAAFSIALGFYAGVFAPALFIGVMFGALMGQLGVMSYFVAPETIGLFALAGMGAVISSTIGAPISTILIVLELTGDYATTIGVTVSVVFSSLVSSRLFGRSLFDRKLLARGHDMSLSRGDYKLSQTPVMSLVMHEYCRLTVGQERDEMVSRLLQSGYSDGYVLDKHGNLMGKVTLSGLLRQSERDQTFEAENFLLGSLSVLDAMTVLSDFIGESLPVVDEEGHFLGVVTEGAIFSHYLSISGQSHVEETQ